MSPVALFFSVIFAVAAALSYPTGWACGLYGGCTTSQMLGCAAGVMFVAYLVSAQFEAQSRKTKPPLPGIRAKRVVGRPLPAMNQRLAISNQWRAAEHHPSSAGATRGLLMLPSPRSARDESL